jgi:hypothetical protein
LTLDTGNPSLPAQGKLGFDFEYYFHPVHNAPVNTMAGMYAFYTVPVVASAGPDLQLGVSITDMSPGTPANSDTDNIYSFRVLPPGARGD